MSTATVLLEVYWVKYRNFRPCRWAKPQGQLCFCNNEYKIINYNTELVCDWVMTERTCSFYEFRTFNGRLIFAANLWFQLTDWKFAKWSCGYSSHTLSFNTHAFEFCTRWKNLSDDVNFISCWASCRQIGSIDNYLDKRNTVYNRDSLQESSSDHLPV